MPTANQAGSSARRAIDPARIDEFYARSFCPELRRSACILDLFEASHLRSLAECLLGEGQLATPEIGQIALRSPNRAAGTGMRPHVDCSYGPNNGVAPGRVAHFTMLAMIALSDVESDFAGRIATDARANQTSHG